MTTHTAFPKGSKVFIILKNDEKFVDYFEDKKSGYVIFRILGKIKISDIRSISFFRNTPD